MAARHKGKKREILALESATETDLYTEYLLHQRHEEYIEQSDDIYEYTAVHRATDAIPKGKIVKWCGDKEQPIRLYEGDNPYRDRLNVFTLSPGQYMESTFGYTEANMLRAPQMIITLCISYMVSNMEAFGANNIWCPDPNLTLAELTDGLNFIKSSVKPEVVTFYKEHKEFFEIMNLAISTMETLSAQNAVRRGNVKDTPNLKSGVALATVIQQANEYNQALEMNYYEMFEDVYSFILWFLKVTAKTERVYEIVGSRAQQVVASFKSDDIQDISRVVIDRVNPIVMNPAGMIEIANDLLEKNLITAQQYFEVMHTGNLESAVESDTMMLDYIAAVKERLLEGQPVPAIPGVNHQLLLQEVTSLLYDLDLTTDPANAPIVKNIQTLIKGQMDIVGDGDMLADIIFGGRPPTPNKVLNQEIPSVADGSTPPPPMGGGAPPPQQPQIAPPQPGPQP